MRNSIFRGLAAVVMVVHFVWALWVIVGSVLIIWWRWYIPLHLVFVGATLGHDFTADRCWFTKLEERLRQAYNPEWRFVRAGFIADHVHRLTGALPSPRVLRITTRTIDAGVILWTLAVWYLGPSH